LIVHVSARDSVNSTSAMNTNGRPICATI
jgi:hypothetical protein